MYSFDRPPVNGERIHQGIDRLVCIGFSRGCEVGVATGGDDVGVAEDFLYLLQADARFDQMGGIAVS